MRSQAQISGGKPSTIAHTIQEIGTDLNQQALTGSNGGQHEDKKFRRGSKGSDTKVILKSVTWQTKYESSDEIPLRKPSVGTDEQIDRI